MSDTRKIKIESPAGVTQQVNVHGEVVDGFVIAAQDNKGQWRVKHDTANEALQRAVTAALRNFTKTFQKQEPTLLPALTPKTISKQYDWKPETVRAVLRRSKYGVGHPRYARWYLTQEMVNYLIEYFRARRR